MNKARAGLLALMLAGAAGCGPGDTFNGATDREGDPNQREPMSGPDRTEQTPASGGAPADSSTTDSSNANPIGAGSGQDPMIAAGTEAAQAQAPTLRQATANASGAYLTNAAGSALYVLEGDTAAQGCDAACAEVWPPYAANDARVTAEAGIDAGKAGQIVRPDGRRQLTFHGQPLYRYAADLGQGRTGGHGVRDRWGHWRLVGPDGKPLPDPAARPHPDRDATER